MDGQQYFCQKYSFSNSSCDLSNDAVLDSGCTSHTFPADTTVHNKFSTPPTLATNCQLPNGHQMTQSHQGTLPISDMPPAAKTLKIYAEHSYKPMLSLGQLVDSEYIFKVIPD